MNAPLEDPLYYLHNFQRVLDWVALRYPDLLDDHEQGFIAAFADLPQPSRALLVRLVMRKGEVFRASKLVYSEIGCPRAAALPLVDLGWLLSDPELHLIARKTGWRGWRPNRPRPWPSAAGPARCRSWWKRASGA